jgi:hypothetical protein
VAYASHGIRRAQRRAYYREHRAEEIAAAAQWRDDHLEAHRADHRRRMTERAREFAALVGTVCERCGAPSTRTLSRRHAGIHFRDASGLSKIQWPLVVPEMVALCEAHARLLIRARRCTNAKHGTRSVYDMGCRCPACTAANSRRIAAYRKRRAIREQGFTDDLG